MLLLLLLLASPPLPTSCTVPPGTRILSTVKIPEAEAGLESAFSSCFGPRRTDEALGWALRDKNVDAYATGHISWDNAHDAYRVELVVTEPELKDPLFELEETLLSPDELSAALVRARIAADGWLSKRPAGDRIKVRHSLLSGVVFVVDSRPSVSPPELHEVAERLQWAYGAKLQYSANARHTANRDGDLRLGFVPRQGGGIVVQILKGEVVLASAPARKSGRWGVTRSGTDRAGDQLLLRLVELKKLEVPVWALPPP